MNRKDYNKKFEESFRKLNQLDRIEYRQRANYLEHNFNYNLFSWFPLAAILIFLSSILLVVLKVEPIIISNLMGRLLVVIMAAIFVDIFIYIYTDINFRKAMSKLNEEFFLLEVKKIK